VILLFLILHLACQGDSDSIQMHLLYMHFNLHPRTRALADRQWHPQPETFYLSLVLRTPRSIEGKPVRSRTVIRARAIFGCAPVDWRPQVHFDSFRVSTGQKCRFPKAGWRRLAFLPSEITLS
jgi:hypothetical protein